MDNIPEEHKKLLRSNPDKYSNYFDKTYGSGMSIKVLQQLEQEEEIFSEAEDTPTILNKYVDALEVNEEQKPKLKRLLDKLYSEALTIT